MANLKHDQIVAGSWLQPFEGKESLSAYLDDLGNFNEALESFARLADSLAAIGGKASVGSDDIQQVCVASPASSCGFGGYSQANYANYPESVRYSYSASTSSQHSGGSGSPCSSDWFCDSPASETRARSITNQPKQTPNSSTADRRSKNANAAEKYRRRLKGHEFRLKTEMEQEEAKNKQLKRQLQSKLALYCEFVDLLAQNTSYQDGDLANLGMNSLELVLSDLKDKFGIWDDRVAQDLYKKYAKFKSILLKG